MPHLLCFLGWQAPKGLVEQEGTRGRAAVCHSLGFSCLQAGVLLLPAEVDFCQMGKLRVSRLMGTRQKGRQEEDFPSFGGGLQGASVGCGKHTLALHELPGPAAQHSVPKVPREQIRVPSAASTGEPWVLSIPVSLSNLLDLSAVRFPSPF